jgi:DNA gyrase inhibitor GyrI
MAGLKIDGISRKRMDATANELIEWKSNTGLFNPSSLGE